MREEAKRTREEARQQREDATEIRNSVSFARKNSLREDMAVLRTNFITSAQKKNKKTEEAFLRLYFFIFFSLLPPTPTVNAKFLREV